MEEKRKINRVEHTSKGVLVVCDDSKQYMIQANNISPLGMGVTVGSDAPELAGKDVIIVVETLIMYADVTRQEKNEDGTFTLGISARKFTPDIFEYLMDCIGNGNE